MPLAALYSLPKILIWEQSQFNNLGKIGKNKFYWKKIFRVSGSHTHESHVFGAFMIV